MHVKLNKNVVFNLWVTTKAQSSSHFPQGFVEYYNNYPTTNNVKIVTRNTVFKYYKKVMSK